MPMENLINEYEISDKQINENGIEEKSIYHPLPPHKDYPILSEPLDTNE